MPGNQVKSSVISITKSSTIWIWTKNNPVSQLQHQSLVYQDSIYYDWMVRFHLQFPCVHQPNPTNSPIIKWQLQNWYFQGCHNVTNRWLCLVSHVSILWKRSQGVPSNSKDTMVFQSTVYHQENNHHDSLGFIQRGDKSPLAWRGMQGMK
jgi:hypothetical protein